VRNLLAPAPAATLLAWEAADVVGLRLSKLAGGGDAAYAEAHLMVTEKMAAGIEAIGSLKMGKPPEEIIQRYREHVAANASRLSVPSAV
jgi:hypothetical protein